MTDPEATPPRNPDEPGTLASISGREWLILALLALAGAVVSLMIQGFRFGISNDVFHVPIALGLYDTPAFADDPFYQSLRDFSSAVWVALSWITSEGNVEAVFFGFRAVTRYLEFFAILLTARVLGLSAVYQLLPVAGLFALSTIFQGSTQVGAHYLFLPFATHTELTYPFLLLSMVLLAERRVFWAFVVNGVTFAINSFVGVWVGLALLLAALAHKAIDADDTMALRIRRSALAIAASLVVAGPTIVWIASGLFTDASFETFDYVAFVDAYYPYHFLIGAAATGGLLATLAMVGTGYTALTFLPDDRRIWMWLYTGFVLLFIVGMVLPEITASQMILNLHLLRVDGVLHLMTVLFVAVVAFRWMTKGQRLGTTPAYAIALIAALATAQWYLVAVAMALCVYESVKARSATAAALAAIVVIAALAAALGMPTYEIKAFHRMAALAGAGLCLVSAVGDRSWSAAGFAVVLLSAVAGDQAHLLFAGSALVMVGLILAREQRVFAAAAIAVGLALAGVGVATGQLAPLAGTVVLQAGMLLAFFVAVRWTAMANWVGWRSAIGAIALFLIPGLGVLPLARAFWEERLPPPQALTSFYQTMTGEPWEAHLVKLRKREAWHDTQRWARAATPETALFMVPVKEEGFQLGSRRRIWVDWKQGAAVMWDPSFYAPWRQRYAEVQALATPEALLAYACTHAVDYVVVARPEEETAPGDRPVAPAYVNDFFEIYASRDYCS